MSEQIIELVTKKQLATLLEKRARLVESNGIEFYRPHWKQHLFHSNGEFRFRYFRSGNRGGKSQCGSAEDVAWALGERPWYKHEFEIFDGDWNVRAVHPGGEDHPLVTKGIPARPTKGVIIAEDWDKVEEIFTSEIDGHGKGKILQYLPKNKIEGYIKGGKGQITGIKVRSRWGGISAIMFDTVSSFRMNEQGHESSSFDWMHMDEPIPEAMWIAYLRGLADVNGPMWALCTQITEPWINDFFIPGARTKLSGDGNLFYDEAMDERKYVVIGRSYDNPYANKKGLKALEVSVSKEQREARIEGGTSTNHGIIYKEFSPDVHVYQNPPHRWDDVHVPPTDYCIRFAIDYHSSVNTPCAVLFVATAPTGHVFFFEEIFDELLVPSMCERILEIVSGYFVAEAICDPHAYIESPRDGSMAVDDMEACGVYPDKAVKDLSRGIPRVREALRRRMPDGTAWLNFAYSLRETVWEFDRYIWNPKNPSKPRDEDDHMMENLYRLVLTGLEYIAPDKGGKAFYVGQLDHGLSVEHNDDSVYNTKFGVDYKEEDPFGDTLKFEK